MRGILFIPGMLALLSVAPAWSAEEFGRLFTTPGQREQLDELRRTQTDISVDIRDEELTVDQVQAVETVTPGELRLRGLVHRKDGKNTAWINDSNSYEGGIAADFTRVKENAVTGTQVVIEMGGEGGRDVSLKVGQSFNPGDGSVLDLGSDRQTPKKADPQVINAPPKF
jgi:hypothetical protein